MECNNSLWDFRFWHTKLLMCLSPYSHKFMHLKTEVFVNGIVHLRLKLHNLYLFSIKFALDWIVTHDHDDHRVDLSASKS